ncbi:MarR family transcriptional regulator [Streptomyces sp. IBSBF 2953]|uniref:MarR family winged helix-turn-helix transcriptional regulator n=1 Tax=Streptomyces TaxID=1883 RepID=UPI00211A09B1|nr:MarR family transcriptional regulator [Streptomyces scabiei]MCQ9182351.1 MarR family transcriptional regulator [Streptomyces hayashii]MDX3113332.1 MarR family transcriptional regulator [Streptomyces scabiei]
MASTAAELLEVLWGRATTAPVSASQLRVLLVLEHREGVSLRTLTEALASTPPSTSRLCDRLQAAGFVERVVSPADRREVRLHISNQGHAFLTDLRTRRESALQAVLDQMPAARRTALLRGLEAFCDAAAAQIHDDARVSGTRTA